MMSLCFRGRDTVSWRDVTSETDRMSVDGEAMSEHEGDSGVESTNSADSMLYVRIAVPDLNIQVSLYSSTRCLLRLGFMSVNDHCQNGMCHFERVCVHACAK